MAVTDHPAENQAVTLDHRQTRGRHGSLRIPPGAPPLPGWGHTPEDPPTDTFRVRGSRQESGLAISLPVEPHGVDYRSRGHRSQCCHFDLRPELLCGVLLLEPSRAMNCAGKVDVANPGVP